MKVWIVKAGIRMAQKFWSKDECLAFCEECFDKGEKEIKVVRREANHEEMLRRYGPNYEQRSDLQ